jgi:hypothetical protein
MIKKTIKMQAFLDKDISADLEGRLLGLVTEEEYAGLVSKPDIRRRLFSVGTKPLKDIFSDKVDVEDKRLVMTITKKDDVEVFSQSLFITNPLEMVSSVVDEQNINLDGKGQTFYMIEEVTK